MTERYLPPPLATLRQLLKCPCCESNRTEWWKIYTGWCLVCWDCGFVFEP